MVTYEYECNHCGYRVKTSGPWPYYGDGRKRASIGEPVNGVSRPVHGLVAEVYCPVCDKEKTYIIAEYPKPLQTVDDIWFRPGAPARLRTRCYKCKGSIALVLPEGEVACPRCRKGAFTSFWFEGDAGCLYPVSPTKTALRVRQGGKSVKVPKPVVIIDSAEHMGYTFKRFTNWFAGTVRRRLPTGDYTLSGLEKEIVIERKTLPDLVNSIIQERKNFIAKCEKLAVFKKKCIVIEGSLSALKTPYQESQAHPNAVLGSIVAVQERWDIPVYFLDTFLLAEEFVASMLSKYHALWWLEANGYERCIIEGDI